MLLDQRIQSFLVLCETMNYTRASERLFVTQPTVSSQIKSLEEECGYKLFYYEGKKLYLTEVGELLSKLAITMKNDALLFKKQLQTLDKKAFHINFAVTMTIGGFVIPRAFARYSKENPQIKMSMILRNTKDIIRQLSTGDVNFALVEGIIKKDDFDYMVFDSVPFVLVCNTNHKFKKKVECMDDILDETLIVREEGSGTRAILSNHLLKHNYTLKNFPNIIEISGMHAIVEMLKEDLGISFMYKCAACEGIKSGLLKEVPLKDFKVFHDFTYIWEKNSAYADLYRTICTTLRDYAKSSSSCSQRNKL